MEVGNTLTSVRRSFHCVCSVPLNATMSSFASLFHHNHTWVSVSVLEIKQQGLGKEKSEEERKKRKFCSVWRRRSERAREGV